VACEVYRLLLSLHSQQAPQEVGMAVADARTDLVERRAGGVGAGLERRLDQLPDGHPASPRYGDAARPPGAGDGAARTQADRVRPLTDAEHAEHVAAVKVRLADARAAGLATEFQHAIDPGGEVWSKERRALHDEIVNDLYAAASDVPCEHKAVLAGGLPGAGKTTVLRECAGINPAQYLMINPDAIKEEMAARGLIPHVDGLTPMEGADLVHEESSHVAKRLARMAQADGKNVIWDVTLVKADSAERRIESLRAGGYAQVDAIFVHIPLEVSVRRADDRYREGHDAYRTGVGYGGRFVREDMILAQADETWGSQNRANFERVKHRFDSWSVYDNSVDGRAPRLVASHSRAHDLAPRTSQ
jgi:predicted ABC-type ATPase